MDAADLFTTNLERMAKWNEVLRIDAGLAGRPASVADPSSLRIECAAFPVCRSRRPRMCSKWGNPVRNPLRA